MVDVERALRDLLTDERLDVPVGPRAVASVHDGVRRRRRRRAVGTVAGVLATAAGVTVAMVVAVSVGRDPRPMPAAWHARFDVPWSALPQTAAWSPPAPDPEPPPADAPRCRADQLSVGRPQTNGATGRLFITLPLRNRSAVACRLIGRPLLVAAHEPGRPDVVAVDGLALPDGGFGGDVAPGHDGYLTLQTDRDCPARYATPDTFPERVYHSLTITLPSGTALTTRLRLDVECGLRTGGLGVAVEPPAAPPDPRRVLVAAIDAPHAVPVGQPLVYVVTLTNPTREAVPLHAPSYVESGQTPGGSVFKEVYGLDVSAHRRLPPGETVRYEMRLETPVTGSPGTLTLRWALATAAPVGATTTVRVLPTDR